MSQAAWAALGPHELRQGAVGPLLRRGTRGPVIRVQLCHDMQLAGPTLDADGRTFQVGDDVLCLRNNRRLGVINGTRGTSPPSSGAFPSWVYTSLNGAA